MKLSSLFKNNGTLYSFVPGPFEIILIVSALVLVFGASKIASIGGAIGRSIGDFRREIRKSKVEENEDEVKLITEPNSRHD